MSLLIKVMSSQMFIIADSEQYYLDSFHFQGENGDAKGFCLSGWLPLYVYVHDFLDAFAQRDWNIHGPILDFWSTSDNSSKKKKRWSKLMLHS